MVDGIYPTNVTLSYRKEIVKKQDPIWRVP